MVVAEEAEEPLAADSEEAAEAAAAEEDPVVADEVGEAEEIAVVAEMQEAEFEHAADNIANLTASG